MSSSPKAQPPPREPDEDGFFPETAPLRRLRLLVTVLTIVLIAGVLTVSVLLVIRLGSGGAGVEPGTLPETVALPEGSSVTAIGRGGRGELLIAIEGEDGARRLRSHDAGTGALLDETEIVPE